MTALVEWVAAWPWYGWLHFWAWYVFTWVSFTAMVRAITGHAPGNKHFLPWQRGTGSVN